MSLVNPGVGETRARPAWSASRFSSEDLPTLERPMKANSGNDSSGHAAKSGALRSKMADEMFTMKTQQPIIAANVPNRYNQFHEGSLPGARLPRPAQTGSGLARRAEVGRRRRRGDLNSKHGCLLSPALSSLGGGEGRKPGLCQDAPLTASLPSRPWVSVPGQDLCKP